MENSDILAEPSHSDLNLSRQNTQPGAVLPEPRADRDSQELPSLDDPTLQQTLHYYILRGRLARQHNASEQHEHD